MVREWGMSKRIGPMAWGSQNQVFLGDDLMHSRDYSDETARIIDEEVERILREQEDRCRETLMRYRPGLDAVAAALLENETIDGAEVHRIITEAMGEAPPEKIRLRRADEDVFARSSAAPLATDGEVELPLP
jgi:cell division protease FtsH